MTYELTSFNNSWAKAFPIPELAPVTTAVGIVEYVSLKQPLVALAR